MLPNLNTFSPSGAVTQEYTLPYYKKGSHVVVVGAGAFGGWSALYLLRSGYHVTLIDAWGSGNSRSSSGDETRVIRSTYGNNKLYFDLNVRALELWKENQERFGKTLFTNAGVLWLCYEDKTALVDDSLEFARGHRQPLEYLTTNDLKKRYPIVNTDDLHHGYLDPFGGYLKARESCQAVQEAFVREGGKFVQALVKPSAISSGRMDDVLLSNGTPIRGDVFLFACGAWLPQVFPDVLHEKIVCTRQEVYYFGVPSHASSLYDQFPVWIDVDGRDFYYGIPGNNNRGFKLGVDIRGERFDPSIGERIVNVNVLEAARRFIGHRFPGLQHAPLIESRVCPYENSADGNFIIDVHPAAENVIIIGGGSGHGFKHGPALGEWIADALQGRRALHHAFRLQV
jgi:glycine/D-amino acid oxidase-like deaminating enzyme